MRISWLTVGRIIERVVAEQSRRRGDPLARLRRIGIDELSYRRGQRYVTVVVCHDSGRLVWAADGRDKQTVERFFDALGRERSDQLELVSSDLGGWITRVVEKRCPRATLCLDPFHVVALPSDAVDQVRREVWNQARRAGDASGARWLKGARWALWKRPERLTDRQRAKLQTIEHVNRRLYRAYPLNEQLRIVFHEPDTAAAIALLDAWLAWARRCRIPSFVKLAKTINDHHAGIVATLTHRLSNARTEAINTTLRASIILDPPEEAWFDLRFMHKTSNWRSPRRKSCGSPCPPPSAPTRCSNRRRRSDRSGATWPRSSRHSSRSRAATGEECVAGPTCARRSARARPKRKTDYRRS